MKGTLIKTEQGWIVEYFQGIFRNVKDDIKQIPLHPDQEKYMHLTGKKQRW